jgi:hypothetical protein
MPDSDHGTPFGEDSPDPIDDWSRAVFEACRDWPLAGSGRWFRVEEGWLRLRIEEVDGEPIEPLFAVDVDLPDGHILLDFGSWGTPIHPLHGPLAKTAPQAVATARSVVEGWFRGATRIVVYSDESGSRGHRLIEGGDLPAALEPAPIGSDEFAKAVVKTWRRSDWRYFHHYGNGIWIELSEGEGGI